MRPIYETDADLAAEREVAGKVATKWKSTPVKLKKYYAVDWALIRQLEVMAFIEIKCRNNSIAKYPTLILSLHKYMGMVSLAIHRPVYLIVKYTDGIYFLAVERISFHLKMGGRTDRNDPDDIEPVIHISTDAFERLI